MPANRNALIRYKTIDKCLQNKFKSWTLDDLIEACSEALYEYEGIDKGVSRRTVQADIQLMRSDKLGYNAPIVVIDKKYYTYNNPEYSITNIPLSEHDLLKLNETVDFLKQFKGFSHFKELDGLVQKFEDHVYSQKTNNNPVIDFEKNEDLKGLEFLDVIYQAIINKRCINITYQSFKARFPDTFEFHCHLLKEFRNRWFVLGIKNRRASILTLALDRIIEVERSQVSYIEKLDFNAKDYYKNAIGVTVSEKLPPEEVKLFVSQKHAPYVLTKPLHHSQKLVKKEQAGIVISLNVQHNFELEKEILGFGDGMKVIAPERLRRSIRNRLNDCLDMYDSEINESGLKTTSRKLQHKGCAVLNYVYTGREIKRMKKEFEQIPKNEELEFNSSNTNLKKLKQTLLSHKLEKVIRGIHNGVEIKSFELSESVIENPWHQDSILPDGKNRFYLTVYLDDSNETNGAIQVFLGSHNKKMEEFEVAAISENSTPAVCNVHSGGISLYHSLLLRNIPQSFSQKKKKVVRLKIEF